MDYSLPASSVHADSPGKKTGGGCHPLLGDLSDPGIKPMSLITPALVGGFFTTSTTWEALSSVQLSCSVVSGSL